MGGVKNFSLVKRSDPQVSVSVHNYVDKILISPAACMLPQSSHYCSEGQSLFDLKRPLRRVVKAAGEGASE